jgi:hypothetical protein
MLMTPTQMMKRSMLLQATRVGEMKKMALMMAMVMTMKSIEIERPTNLSEFE